MRFTWWVLLLSIPVGSCGGAEAGSGALDRATAGSDSAGNAGEAGMAGQDQGAAGTDVALAGTTSAGAAAEGGSGNAPSQGGSGNAPSQGGSGNAPSQGGSGNAPSQGGSGNAPSQGGSGNAPSQGGSGNAPSQGGSGNVPAQGGAPVGVGGGTAFCTVQTSSTSANANVIDATEGHFEDHCDANGDLVQYQCETIAMLDPNCAYYDSALPLPSSVVAPNCGYVYVPTGNVIEGVYACAGRCQDAACPDECPDYDEKVTYLAIDPSTGRAEFSFPRFNKTLDCELIFDRDSDGYDCMLDPQPNREVDLPSLGLSSLYCLEGDIGNIGMDDPTHGGIEECAYRCDVVP